MTKKILVVTHDSGFHTDDVFAVAALALLLGEGNIDVQRSRDPEVIAQGDYVLDVGMVYDPTTNRFDHHQAGGAGTRENGIPYASFGLVWKHFGERIAGSHKMAEAIDKRLVQPVDAHDNGVDFYTLTVDDVEPYTIGHYMGVAEPAWNERLSRDEAFHGAVRLARQVIEREIVHQRHNAQALEFIRTAYQTASDKRCIVIESIPPISRSLIMQALAEYPEPLFAVRNHEEKGVWQVMGVRAQANYFKNRKDLPESWAGKSGEELARITGVPDAYFCHNKRFMCLARSKEGALKLAQLALTLS